MKLFYNKIFRKYNSEEKPYFIKEARIVENESELKMLLTKNLNPGLDPYEKHRALELIADPSYSDMECMKCRPGEKDKAIYDTGLCRKHAYYNLVIRR